MGNQALADSHRHIHILKAIYINLYIITLWKNTLIFIKLIQLRELLWMRKLLSKIVTDKKNLQPDTSVLSIINGQDAYQQILFFHCIFSYRQYLNIYLIMMREFPKYNNTGNYNLVLNSIIMVMVNIAKLKLILSFMK